MKITTQDILGVLNESKEQAQINQAAKEVHDFLFSGGGKAIDMDNFIDQVLKDHKLSRSDRKAVATKAKQHGYTGKLLDKFLSESHVNESLNESAALTFDRVTTPDSKGRKAITYKDSEGRESYPVEFSPKMIDEKKLVEAVRKILG